MTAAETVFSGKHKLEPISFPLHEAVGLSLLYQAVPAEMLWSLKIDDVIYGLGASYGYLRIRAAIAELFADEDGLNLVATERAMLDQIDSSFT